MVSPILGPKVYVDASALIYAVETPQLFPRLQTHFLDLFSRGQLTIATSWITLAEVLIRPLQTGDALAEAGYRAFFSPSGQFEILPVDHGIASQAAVLRALHGFKLPDAIHIATGMSAKCTSYLTGDSKWAKTGLPVIEASNL